MKRLILIVCLAASSFYIGWLLSVPSPSQKGRSHPDADITPMRAADPVAANKVIQKLPDLAARKRMSQADRLRSLEEYGEVPAESDEVDWLLAPNTSWWGKPLDPKEFWKGRIIWLDSSAQRAAQRRGRSFPPMPYDNSRFSKRSDKDFAGFPTAEGPNTPFHFSDKENVFWSDFYKTHPIPPEFLESKSFEVEDGILRARGAGNAAGMTPQLLANLESSLKREPVELNYPKEAFTDDALLWEYILKKRHDYETLLQGGRDTNSMAVKDFLERLPVSASQVTDPLTDEQVQAANAWKVAYLQRLQEEHVDQSYINAYLEAWNLPTSSLSNKIKSP
jgi:hypothetical protein